MTNMFWAGLGFLIVIVGLPVLCVIFLAGWLVHMSKMKKNWKEAGQNRWT